MTTQVNKYRWGVAVGAKVYFAPYKEDNVGVVYQHYMSSTAWDDYPHALPIAVGGPGELRQQRLNVQDTWGDAETATLAAVVATVTHVDLTAVTHVTAVQAETASAMPLSQI